MAAWGRGLCDTGRCPALLYAAALVTATLVVCSAPFATASAHPSQETPVSTKKPKLDTEQVSKEQWEQLAERLQTESITEQHFATWRDILDPLRQFPSWHADAPLHLDAIGFATPVAIHVDTKATIAPSPTILTSHGGHADLLLTDLSFVIDPGHFGGTWSAVENRVVRRGRHTVEEGNLNWGTALLLQKALRRYGATVRLSRSAPPSRKFPTWQTLSTFLQKDCPQILQAMRQAMPKRRLPHWLQKQPDQAQAFCSEIHMATNQREWFKIYNRFDFRRRSDLAQDSEIFLSLHHNLAVREHINRVVVFMHGGILPLESRQPSDQYYALRKLLSGDPRPTIALGSAIAEQMSTTLNLPSRPMTLDHRHTDPNAFAVANAPGLFARNLGVLKRSRGIALLIEGPCMNNPQEHFRLRAREFKLGGRWYPQRIVAYANAVTQGIIRASPVLNQTKGLYVTREPKYHQAPATPPTTPRP